MIRIPKEFKGIAKQLRALGYQFEARKTGHIAILTPEGKFVWGMAGTPSDHRAAHKLRCDLRKRGIPL